MATSGLPPSGMTPGSYPTSGTTYIPAAHPLSTSRAAAAPAGVLSSTDLTTAAVAPAVVKATIEPDDTKTPLTPAHKVVDKQAQLKGLLLSDGDLINHYLKNCGKHEISMLKSSGIANAILGLLGGAAAIGLCIIFPPAAFAGVIMGGYMYLAQKQETAQDESIRMQETENKQIAQSNNRVISNVNAFSEALKKTNGKDFEEFLEKLGFPPTYTWTREDVQFIAEEALPRFEQFKKAKGNFDNAEVLVKLGLAERRADKHEYLLDLKNDLHSSLSGGASTIALKNDLIKRAIPEKIRKEEGLKQLLELEQAFIVSSGGTPPAKLTSDIALVDYKIAVLKNLEGKNSDQVKFFLDLQINGLHIKPLNDAKKLYDDGKGMDKANRELDEWIAANKRAAPASPASPPAAASPAAAAAVTSVDIEDDTMAAKTPSAAASPLAARSTPPYVASDPASATSLIPGIGPAAAPPLAIAPALPPIPAVFAPLSSPVDTSVASGASDTKRGSPPTMDPVPTTDPGHPRYFDVAAATTASTIATETKAPASSPPIDGALTSSTPTPLPASEPTSTPLSDPSAPEPTSPPTYGPFPPIEPVISSSPEEQPAKAPSSNSFASIVRKHGLPPPPAGPPPR